MSDNFQDLNSLETYMLKKQKGHISIPYQDLPEYSGMALSLMIFFDLSIPKYELDLQWISLGLDLYGDTLQESYVYRFDQLEQIMEYLSKNYKVTVTDIPIQFRFQMDKFPNPIQHADQAEEFQTAWTQFRKDFAQNKFLDNSLNLVYSSYPDNEL